MSLKQLFLPVLLVLAVSVSAQDKHAVKDTGMIFKFVEQMPQSDFDYLQYLAENLHYPDSARIQGIEGKVIVKFFIDETGQIGDCVIAKSVSKELDEEALRVIRMMPRWKPGRRNGKPVKDLFTAPINFKLENQVD